MKRPATSTFALGLALSLVPLPVTAQSRPLTPVEVAGCYALTLGLWSRPLEGDPRYHALPDTVRLDTLPAEHGGWRLSPDIAYPGGHRFPGRPRWLVKGDSVELGWSNGFVPTVVSLARRANGTLRGRVVALSDAHVAGEPPPPSALVTARRVSCPASGVPRGADGSGPAT
jgi:hypothetical protein